MKFDFAGIEVSTRPFVLFATFSEFLAWACPQLGLYNHMGIAIVYYDLSERKWKRPSSKDDRYIIAPFYGILDVNRHKKMFIRLLE